MIETILACCIIGVLCLLPLAMATVFVATCYRRGWVTWADVERMQRAIREGVVRP